MHRPSRRPGAWGSRHVDSSASQPPLVDLRILGLAAQHVEGSRAVVRGATQYRGIARFLDTGMRSGAGLTLPGTAGLAGGGARGRPLDRKSTRLNSSHQIISYALFFLQ